MGYRRHQFQVGQKWPKRVKHARVLLCAVRCVDCQSVLSSTHVFGVFGEQCRACWLTDVSGGSALFVEAG